MKICCYSPYVPKHTGGGEKYFFDCVSTMIKLGHDVSVAIPSSREFTQPASPSVLDEKSIRQKYQDFLGYSLEKVNFITTPLNTSASFLETLAWTRQFDVMYYVTDGSFFFSSAKRNIAHIQIPFTNPQHGFLNRAKLANWSIKNANSGFTQKIVTQAWQTPIQFVHYPLIEKPTAAVNLAKKEKVILHVGRFFRQLHSKRQDVLVEIFKQLHTQYPALLKGWKLVFIGAVEDQSYFDEVKAAAKGLPISFFTDLSRQALLDWYALATVYWHATGFAVDAEREPSKVEHFGISTVEAMSYGCLPVVLAQGGQREVLGDTLAELGWQTKQECVEISRQLLADASRRKTLAQQAMAQAQSFGPAQFTHTLERMLTS